MAPSSKLLTDTHSVMGVDSQLALTTTEGLRVGRLRLYHALHQTVRVLDAAVRAELDMARFPASHGGEVSQNQLHVGEVRMLDNIVGFQSMAESDRCDTVNVHGVSQSVCVVLQNEVVHNRNFRRVLNGPALRRKDPFTTDIDWVPWGYLQSASKVQQKMLGPEISTTHRTVANLPANVQTLSPRAISLHFLKPPSTITLQPAPKQPPYRLL